MVHQLRCGLDWTQLDRATMVGKRPNRRPHSAERSISASPSRPIVTPRSVLRMSSASHPDGRVELGFRGALRPGNRIRWTMVSTRFSRHHTKSAVSLRLPPELRHVRESTRHGGEPTLLVDEVRRRAVVVPQPTQLLVLQGVPELVGGHPVEVEEVAVHDLVVTLRVVGTRRIFVVLVEVVPLPVHPAMSIAGGSSGALPDRSRWC